RGVDRRIVGSALVAGRRRVLLSLHDLVELSGLTYVEPGGDGHEPGRRRLAKVGRAWKPVGGCPRPRRRRQSGHGQEHECGQPSAEEAESHGCLLVWNRGTASKKLALHGGRGQEARRRFYGKRASGAAGPGTARSCITLGPRCLRGGAPYCL